MANEARVKNIWIEALVQAQTATIITTVPAVITYTGIQAAIAQPQNIDTTPANIIYTGVTAGIDLFKVINTTPAVITYTGITAEIINDINRRTLQGFFNF